ncbi:unnamed protein product [Caenorhabditis auriculariae]|uniref:Fucosyltransferase n=1 Tax=Caenorhabditis auriculariae TaxID=2777116 RepID=A0A8S1HAD8_9PELO|nr:unnamed protein product [Caenorhabditis auriculariae]
MAILLISLQKIKILFVAVFCVAICSLIYFRQGDWIKLDGNRVRAPPQLSPYRIFISEAHKFPKNFNIFETCPKIKKFCEVSTDFFIILTRFSRCLSFDENVSVSIHWIMSYKVGSEVYFPRGFFHQENSNLTLDNIWSKKDAKKSILFLKGCGEEPQEKYVEFLGKMGLKIDHVDACHVNSNINYDEFGEYMLIFALESSQCVSFITEKVFDIMSKAKAVPIVPKSTVFAGHQTPKSSYISIEEGGFKQNIELAIWNKTEYLKYHEWRRTMRLLPKWNEFTGFCSLCNKLIENQRKPLWNYYNIYDLKKFFTSFPCEKDVYKS